MRRKSPWEIQQKLKEEHHRKASCEGKRKYLDEASANSRAAWDRKNYKNHRIKGRPDGHRAYLCIFCGFWHIGTLTNPNYRPDFHEVVNKAHAIHQQFRNGATPVIESLFEKGLIRKEALKHGAYYLGWCRHAKVARWHAEDQLFFYAQYAGEKEYEEGIPYPQPLLTCDWFVAVSETRPTDRQVVYAAFGEAAKAQGV